MTFILRVEHKNKALPERVTLGIRVREDAPRNTIEVPTVYRQFEYHTNGRAVMGDVVRFGSTGGAHFQRVQNEHLYHQETRTYTFQKNSTKWESKSGGGVGGRVMTKQPIRLINMVRPIADALISSYGHVLDIRECMTKKEYLVAETFEGSPEVEKAISQMSSMDGKTFYEGRTNTPNIQPDGTYDPNPTEPEQEHTGAIPAGHAMLPNGKLIKLQDPDELFKSESDANREMTEAGVSTGGNPGFGGGGETG